jgi:hypothetical protein
MTYAEAQKERAARASTTPFHRAVIAMRSNPDCCVCLVEGPSDLPFYRPLLTIYQGNHGCRQIIPFVGGNRNAVIYAREQIGDREDRARFIIDRDHSGFAGQDEARKDTFVTDYYSVESYVIGLNRLRQFLSDLFLLDFDSFHIKNLLELHQRSFDEFKDGLLSAHARIIMEKQRNNPKHISDLSPHEFFSINSHSIVWAGGSAESAGNLMLRRLGIAELELEQERAELHRIESILRCIDPLLWVHGKFLLHHFIRLLDSWYKRTREIDDQHGHRPAIMLPLNASAIMNKCATFHRDVPSLTQFLDEWENLRIA